MTEGLLWGVSLESTVNFEKDTKVVLLENGPKHYCVYKRLGVGHCGVYPARIFRLTGEVSEGDHQQHQEQVKEFNNRRRKVIKQVNQECDIRKPKPKKVVPPKPKQKTLF